MSAKGLEQAGQPAGGAGGETNAARGHSLVVAGREGAGSLPAPGDWGTRGQEAVLRIPVAVRIVLGAARMPVSKLMGLSRGAIIPLDRKVGDLVDIVVNDRLIARGEVVVLDDKADRFAVAVREVVRADEA
jgi:flagellar motor switch protein FliN/FliY